MRHIFFPNLRLRICLQIKGLIAKIQQTASSAILKACVLFAINLLERVNRNPSVYPLRLGIESVIDWTFADVWKGGEEDSISTAHNSTRCEFNWKSSREQGDHLLLTKNTRRSVLSRCKNGRLFCLDFLDYLWSKQYTNTLEHVLINQRTWRYIMIFYCALTLLSPSNFFWA